MDSMCKSLNFKSVPMPTTCLELGTAFFASDIFRRPDTSDKKSLLTPNLDFTGFKPVRSPSIQLCQKYPN